MIWTLLSTLLLAGSVSAQSALLGPTAIKLHHRPALRHSLNKRESAVVIENVLVDSQWVMDIKTVGVFLDASSSVIRLYGRPNYDPKTATPLLGPGFAGNESSTFQRLSRQNNLASASLAADMVTFGGDTANATFWYVPDCGCSNPSTWGFGFPDYDYDPDRPSFWHNVSASGADKRIGVFLSRHNGETDERKDKIKMPVYKDGEIMLGGVNEKKFTGEIFSTPFTPDEDGGWMVPLEGIRVNGNAINLTYSNVSKPFNGPNALPGQLKARVEPTSMTAITWEFPCNSTSNIDIRFTIGGKEYAMDGRDLIAGWTSPSNIPTSSLPPGITMDGYTPGYPEPNAMCVGEFISDDSMKGIWRLGPAFLKNVYTVFDFATPAVRFAQLSPDAQPDVKPSESGAASSGVASISAVFVGIAATAAACLL